MDKNQFKCYGLTINFSGPILPRFFLLFKHLIMIRDFIYLFELPFLVEM